MKLHEIVATIVKELESVSHIEGVFLSGSLANEHEDQYSDIDLGIATRDNPAAFNEVYAMRHQLLITVGQPIQTLERGWQHCLMVAALYGKSQFPPIGLEIDLIFSQLNHVAEQMPYADYRILFDRDGKLRQMLDETSRSIPGAEIEQELRQHLSWYLFFVYDALKAHERKDSFALQALLEEMRKLIFQAAAARCGLQVYGAKRALKYLSTGEKKVIEKSYRHSTRRSIEKLAALYLVCLDSLLSDYEIEQEVGHFRHSLSEVL